MKWDASIFERDDEDYVPFPSLQSRLLGLLIGSLYLWLLGILFSQLTATPLWLAMPVVFACAAVVIAVLANFCVKFVKREEGDRRLSLASLLLLFIPATIYLTGVRLFLNAIAEEPLSWALLIFVIALVVLALLLTTAILLWMGEACVWLILALLRYVRR